MPPPDRDDERREVSWRVLLLFGPLREWLAGKFSDRHTNASAEAYYRDVLGRTETGRWLMAEAQRLGISVNLQHIRDLTSDGYRVYGLASPDIDTSSPLGIELTNGLKGRLYGALAYAHELAHLVFHETVLQAGYGPNGRIAMDKYISGTSSGSEEVIVRYVEAQIRHEMTNAGVRGVIQLSDDPLHRLYREVRGDRELFIQRGLQLLAKDPLYAGSVRNPGIEVLARDFAPPTPNPETFQRQTPLSRFFTSVMGNRQLPGQVGTILSMIGLSSRDLSPTWAHFYAGGARQTAAAADLGGNIVALTAGVLSFGRHVPAAAPISLLASVIAGTGETGAHALADDANSALRSGTRNVGALIGGLFGTGVAGPWTGMALALAGGFVGERIADIPIELQRRNRSFWMEHGQRLVRDVIARTPIGAGTAVNRHLAEVSRHKEAALRLALEAATYQQLAAQGPLSADQTRAYADVAERLRVAQRAMDAAAARYVDSQITGLDATQLADQISRAITRDTDLAVRATAAVTSASVDDVVRDRDHARRVIDAAIATLPPTADVRSDRLAVLQPRPDEPQRPNNLAAAVERPTVT